MAERSWTTEVIIVLLLCTHPNFSENDPSSLNLKLVTNFVTHQFDEKKIYLNFFFRFCVAVRRKNYPSETESLMVSPKDMSRWIQPAHTISFVPPVTIVNLLPCHLSFRIVGYSKTNTDVSPGKKSFISVSE